MSFEPILQHLSGHIGLYQILVVLLLGVYVDMLIGIQVFIPVFVAFKQEYRCALNSTVSSANQSTNFSRLQPQCSVVDNATGMETPCDEWIFDQSVFQSTVRSQFDLVCNNEWQVSLGSTLLMLGILIGSFVFGILSDRFGRLSMMTVGLTIITLSSFGGAFVPYFWMYNCLRFFIGLSIAALFVTINTYISEISHQAYRMYFLMIAFSGYSFGGCLLCLIAYFERDHYNIQIICACMWTPVFIFPVFLTESPRWLVINGHIKKAWKACQKISKINRRPFMDRAEFEELCQNVKEESNDERQSLDKILRLQGLRQVSLVIWYCFSVASFVYYIISYGSGSLGINVFVNFGLMSIMDVPVKFLICFISAKYGRIKLMMISGYFLAGLFILCSAFLYGKPHLSMVLTVFSMLSRVSICISFDVIWVYSLDIYPTVARTSGVGAASTFARVASLLSPQMENLIKVWPPLPFLITGILPLLAGLLTWRFLPETSKMRTKDYLEETEEFIKKTQSHRKCFSRDCLCCRAINDRDIEVEVEETKKLNDEEIKD